MSISISSVISVSSVVKRNLRVEPDFSTDIKARASSPKLFQKLGQFRRQGALNESGWPLRGWVNSMAAACRKLRSRARTLGVVAASGCFVRREPALVEAFRSAVGRRSSFGRPVERVAHHRMANRRHVYADLMSAAGLDADVHQRELAERRRYALANFIMRDGCAASAAAGCHANAPHHIAADLGIDGAAVFRWPAMHQRHVALLHLPPGELLRPACGASRHSWRR